MRLDLARFGPASTQLNVSISQSCSFGRPIREKYAKVEIGIVRAYQHQSSGAAIAVHGLCQPIDGMFHVQ